MLAVCFIKALSQQTLCKTSIFKKFNARAVMSYGSSG